MYKLSGMILLLFCTVMVTAGLVYAGGGCGDGVLQEALGEQCDDGNLINGDGCSMYCMIEVCGDGILQEALGEQCDDGNLINGDGCNFYCKNEVCGDGIMQEALGEMCDDGNLISGDGCSAVCALEYGNQGCMPNYWKKPQHIGSWPAPFTPDTMFSGIFADAFPGKTLLQVLSRGGSGLHALGRHAVAALLNAASSDVAYDLTVPQVATMFNAVYSGPKHDHNSLKAILRAYNKRDCPLGGVSAAGPDNE